MCVRSCMYVSACMCVCVRVCMCVCARVRVYVCACICACVCMCVCARARMCVRAYMCVRASMCVRACMCLCACMCVCVYVFVRACLRVSVALVIQHGMRMRRIIFVILGLSGSTIFFHFYLINGTIFDKKLMNIKICVLSLQLLSKTFLILRRSERDMIINLHLSSRKVPVILDRY